MNQSVYPKNYKTIQDKNYIPDGTLRRATKGFWLLETEDSYILFRKTDQAQLDPLPISKHTKEWYDRLMGMSAAAFDKACAKEFDL